MKKTLLLCIMAFSVALISKGTTYNWTGSSNTNWNNSGNWFPSTGFPVAGDIATISTASNMPTVNVASACANLVINGSTTITLSAALTVSGGLTVNNTSTLTFAGTSSASIAGTSFLTYNTSLVIGANNTITFPASSSLTMSGNNLNTITNNGTLTFTGSTLTFGFLSTFANNGTLNATSATMNFSGNNNIITNTKTISATSSTFNINSQFSGITNNSGATVTASSSTFNLSANNTALTNSGTFSCTSCPLNLTGQASNITNSGSSATFTAGACPIVLSTQNTCNITNGTGSTFLAYGGSSISISSYQGYIVNNGNFYAGSSNSACPITLSAQGSYITNSGTFYVGSTSGITLTGYQGLVTNNSSGFFIFQSDAFGSAYVGAIPTAAPATASGQFVGTFQVQRYITGGAVKYRGYRLLSSPVYASTVSSNNVYSLNYVQSSALVTGSAGGGFDKTGNPSLYLYRENTAVSNSAFATGNYRGISSLLSAPTYSLNNEALTYSIPVGNGFLFFFRGDRTTNLANKYKPGTSAESVTMTASGTLNTMQITVYDWYTPASSNLGYTLTAGNTAVRGYNMVGNPYASNIDWETYQTTTPATGIYAPNVGATIYLLNPANQNYGAYTQGGGGNGTNNATNIIASGQGFFVVAANSSAQLIFNESAKTTAQATGLHLFMGKPPSLANTQYLRLQLAADSINTDDILIRFSANAGTAYSSAIDAPYFQGYGQVSLSSFSSDHVALAINVQPLPKTSETINLSVNAKSDGIYSLNMKNLVGIPQLYDIWLMDAYTKDSVDMRHNKNYSFNVLKSDTNTFGSKRFTLVIRQNPAYAYQLLDFTALKVAPVAKGDNQVQLTWKTENEQNYTNFTVERSIDNGKTFDVIGGLPSSDLGIYSLLDKSPVVGQNLYRLKQEDLNSTISYSSIVPIMYTNLADNLTKNAISVYPNPAKSNITLSIANDTIANSAYNIQVTNSSGLLIRQAISSQLNWQADINDLLPGTYFIKVFNNNNKSVVGQTKFIKM